MLDGALETPSLDAVSAKEFCEHWLAAWMGGVACVDHKLSFYAPDATYADPGPPDGVRGRDTLRAYLARFSRRMRPGKWMPVEGFPDRSRVCLEVTR
jgi:hypothetical protein